MRTVLLVALLWAAPVLAEPGTDAQNHEPINIVANEDFGTPASGVRSGTGTVDDPYIIADWTIVRPMLNLGTTVAAIHIENTDAHVVLRNIQVIVPFTVGIEIQEASNVTIEKVELTGQANSIALSRVVDVKLNDIDITDGGPGVAAGGVYLNNGQRVVMHNVVILDGAGLGLQVSSSKFVNMQGVRVSSHAGGMRIQSSTDVDMIGVQADSNRGDGIWISNVTRVQVLGMHVTDQKAQGGFGTGRGVVIWESQGKVQGLDSLRNEGSGAFFQNTDLELFNARFLDNGGAGVQFAAPDVSIKAVEAHHNGGAGIEIFGPEEGLPFLRAEAVQVHDNRGPGLYAQGLQGLTLQGVRAQMNGGAGIEIRSSGNLSLLNSHLLDNSGAGLLLGDVQNGQIRHTDASGNGKDGFALRLSGGLTVQENIANNNGASGFVLDGQGMILRNNEAKNNGEYGIRLLPAAGNATLVGNVLVDNEAGDGLPQQAPANGMPGGWVLLPLLLALFVRHKLA